MSGQKRRTKEPEEKKRRKQKKKQQDAAARSVEANSVQAEQRIKVTKQTVERVERQKKAKQSPQTLVAKDQQPKKTKQVTAAASLRPEKKLFDGRKKGSKRQILPGASLGTSLHHQKKPRFHPLLAMIEDEVSTRSVAMQ